MENTSLVITEEQDNNKQVGVNNDITNVLYSFSKQQLLDWDHNSLLSSDEEIILTNLAKAGKNAREIIKISGEINGKELYFLKNKIEIAKLAVSILIISNQGLVYNTAKELTGIKKPTKDVIQEGNMGIMKAAEKFDHLKGNKFSTYASWWIKQRILLHIKTNKVITLPIKIAGKISTLKRMLGDNNLKLEEITEKDITLLIKIGIFNRKEILKLITAAKNENLLSIDWENDEGESFIYNTISDGKNNPEKIFFQKKTDEMIRDNIRNLFLDKENATYNKRGVIISLRNNIHGLNDNIVEILVKLTKSRDINTIERTSSRIVDLYLKYRDTILITLRSMIENEEKLSQDLIDTIDKICKKIIYLGNNMDFIIKDFIEKDETTALLFCLIEDYNQKNKNNKKIIIEETIKSIFIDNKHNIIKYFDFIRELLFLYSHKITNIEITDDELEILYRSFIKNIGTDPTLQDLGILFSVTRERIRQMEEKGLERFKKYFLNKNLFSKN